VFLAAINENPVLPVNVLGGEIRGVRLRCAGFIEQLIVGAAFWIFFGSDDGCVFFCRDRSFA